jgi:hypothetical protein
MTLAKAGGNPPLAGVDVAERSGNARLGGRPFNGGILADH